MILESDITQAIHIRNYPKAKLLLSRFLKQIVELLVNQNLSINLSDFQSVSAMIYFLLSSHENLNSVETYHNLLSKCYTDLNFPSLLKSNLETLEAMRSVLVGFTDGGNNIEWMLLKSLLPLVDRNININPVLESRHNESFENEDKDLLRFVYEQYKYLLGFLSDHLFSKVVDCNEVVFKNETHLNNFIKEKHLVVNILTRCKVDFQIHSLRRIVNSLKRIALDELSPEEVVNKLQNLLVITKSKSFIDFENIARSWNGSTTAANTSTTVESTMQPLSIPPANREVDMHFEIIMKIFDILEIRDPELIIVKIQAMLTVIKELYSIFKITDDSQLIASAGYFKTVLDTFESIQENHISFVENVKRVLILTNCRSTKVLVKNIESLCEQLYLLDQTKPCTLEWTISTLYDMKDLLSTTETLKIRNTDLLKQNTFLKSQLEPFEVYQISMKDILDFLDTAFRQKAPNQESKEYLNKCIISIKTYNQIQNENIVLKQSNLSLKKEINDLELELSALNDIKLVGDHCKQKLVDNENELFELHTQIKSLQEKVETYEDALVVATEKNLENANYVEHLETELYKFRGF